MCRQHLVYRPTDRPTDSCNTICPLFQGEHKNECCIRVSINCYPCHDISMYNLTTLIWNTVRPPMKYIKFPKMYKWINPCKIQSLSSKLLYKNSYFTRCEKFQSPNKYFLPWGTLCLSAVQIKLLLMRLQSCQSQTKYIVTHLSPSISSCTPPPPPKSINNIF